MTFVPRIPWLSNPWSRTSVEPASRSWAATYSAAAWLRDEPQGCGPRAARDEAWRKAASPSIEAARSTARRALIWGGDYSRVLDFGLDPREVKRCVPLRLLATATLVLRRHRSRRGP